MPKIVLVICSSWKDRDFPREENQVMLKKLLGEDYVPEFMKEYPQDLPSGKQFDAILFAGCNVLTWLFGYDNKHEPGMNTLSTILKDDGIIIFVENTGYIKALSGEGHYEKHVLSIPIENIQLFTTIPDNGSGLKQEIIQSWKKYFTQTQADKYIVYKKNKEGGKRKRRSLTRRKRKTRYSK